MKSVRAILRKEFPISRRVVVSFGECEDGNAAETWMDGGTIRICIDDTLSPSSVRHMLCHEWAHARLFDRAGRACTRHSVAWAMEYAAIYERIFGNE